MSYTFTPPLEPDLPMSHEGHPSHKLFKHYPQRRAGVTVWKDEGGVWNHQLYPYQGGEIYRVYNHDVSTISAPVPGLSTAQVVFLGGHTYEVNDAMATELLAAGYGDGLNMADSSFIWTEEDIPLLRNQIASPGVGELVMPPFIDGEECIQFPLDNATMSFSSGRRDFWLDDRTSGWTDFYFKVVLRPLNFGLQGDGTDLLPQVGVVLRHKTQSGKMRGVTINNNIFLRIGFPNIGVWEHNPDGTGFANRQFSYPLFDTFAFPYVLEGTLVGSTVSIWTYPFNGASTFGVSPYYKVIDLDGGTAGNPVTIPTPTGEGVAGVISAHSTENPLGYCRLGTVTFKRLS